MDTLSFINVVSLYNYNTLNMCNMPALLSSTLTSLARA